MQAENFCWITKIPLTAMPQIIVYKWIYLVHKSVVLLLIYTPLYKLIIYKAIHKIKSNYGHETFQSFLNCRNTLKGDYEIL